jgi:LysR family transcriptional regulator, low CO2-responsive transcriptional regulator
MPASYTLHQLHLFVAVVEHASVSRAAAALHVTQPTVSMQIKQLADVLGVALFEPVARRGGPRRPRMRLTPAGAEVHEAARSALRLTRELDERLAALAGGRRGRVRVCAASTAEYFVPRLLGAFQRDHPDVEVELQVVNRGTVLERLQRDDDDLYIMAQPPLEMHVVAQPFADNPLVVVAPVRHPLVGRASVALDELVRHAWVVREEGAGTRLMADNYLAARSVKLSARLRLGSNEAVKQAVIGGFGLAILSLHALRDELLYHRRIQLLPVEGFPIGGRWHWVRRAERHLSPLTAAVCNFAGAHAAALDAELVRLLNVARTRTRARKRLA